MTKDEVKALIDSKAQEIKDAVDSISGSNEELEAQLAAALAALSSKQAELDAASVQLVEKDAAIASKQVELDEKNAKLAQVDSLAKQLDALIPDATESTPEA